MGTFDETHMASAGCELGVEAGIVPDNAQDLVEDRRGVEWVVTSVQEQGGDPNAIEETDGGGPKIVVCGIGEAVHHRRKGVVELPKRAGRKHAGGVGDAWMQRDFLEGLSL